MRSTFILMTASVLIQWYVRAYVLIIIIIIVYLCVFVNASKEGEIWPNSQADVSVIFKPGVASRSV